MAINFRTPQEGVSEYEKALKTMKLIQDIVSNPDVHATMKQLSNEVVSISTISSEKLKELHAAEETIAQSKEIANELEAAKVAHDNKVASDLAEVNAQNRTLENSKKAWAIEQAKASAILDKFTKEVTTKHTDAKTIAKLAEEKLAVAKELERSVSETLKAHTESAAKFEEEKAVALENIASKNKAHENSLKVFAEEKQAFELRKKRFEAALKD